jgi:hypothetical protein
MKFLNVARDEIHGPAAVEVTAAELLECMKRPLPESGGAEALLRQFRRLEKGEA